MRMHEFFRVMTEWEESAPEWSADLPWEWYERLAGDSPVRLGEIDGAIAVAVELAAGARRREGGTYRQQADVYVGAARIQHSWLRSNPNDNETVCLVGWLLAFWLLRRASVLLPIRWAYAENDHFNNLPGWSMWSADLEHLDEAGWGNGWAWCAQHPESLFASEDFEPRQHPALPPEFRGHRNAAVLVAGAEKRANRPGLTDRRRTDVVDLTYTGPERRRLART